MAHLVWGRLGNVPNYVEPFFGSGAMLLGRPHQPGIETVNDKDGFVANFWRALQHDPEGVASYADYPVSECDLHARHTWLRAQKASFVPRLEGDPNFYDVKIAGWWVWGISAWIGGGFCGDSGSGPWVVQDGQLVHLGHAGQGVSRQRVDLGRAGQGLLDWLSALANRLRFVRVCCGDWSRICGPSPTIKQGLTGVFLDPPYSQEAGRNNHLYSEEDLHISHLVREWALQWGEHPLMRIALCGYAGEHMMPDHWAELAWKTGGEYSGIGHGPGQKNSTRERIWFSPYCLQAQQERLL